MKTKILSLFTFFLIFNTSEGHSQSVEKFNIDNNTYYGTKAIPDEITGLYKYEKTKEPIVDIRKDGTGFLQVHDVKAYPIVTGKQIGRAHV